MRKVLFFFLFLFFSFSYGQQPEKPSSGEIFKDIQKLNFLGSALYIAAHPDDENTRLISYLSNELHARTAYLSLTRGDGGQNLIGSQLRELLGVIRTQELLAARKIDGGEQYFTRANDFGYSKHPDETLDIWNKDEILKDVVRTIRKFRPDVIINRFSEERAGETHGHHTSSALLSREAFEVSEKDTVFPSLAEQFGTWKPKKLFFNTSPWFYESQEAFEKADKSDFLEFDTGVYFPLLGLSNTEIASLSRSQHQSQGFGSTGSRGKEMEYIKLIEGTHPAGNNDPFAGINTSWSRVKGGTEIGKILDEVETSYDFQNPSASIPALIQAYNLIRELEDDHWRELKTEEIKNIIAACAGLYMEAVADIAISTPGEKILVNLEVINRSPVKAELTRVKIVPAGNVLQPLESLEENKGWKEQVSLTVPEDHNYTSPYWLRKEGSLGMYEVEDKELIGLAETPREFKTEFTLNIEGTPITFERELIYKRNDAVKGEQYQPFEVVPAVSVSTANGVEIFADERPKEFAVTVKAAGKNMKGSLHLDHPSSWKISPESFSFDLTEKGAEKTFYFMVTPPEFQEEILINPVARVNGTTYTEKVVQLDYDHIPVQTIVLPARTKVVKLDIQKKGELVGYIQGAGDVVPEALQQIGYTVAVIPPAEISAESLKAYDAIVVGIRAYNTVDALQYKQQELLKYVKNGGNLIIQYNTSRGLKTDNLAPYPLELSRDRVTDEGAEVRILEKDHPVLNFPNKITAQDFEGWVQERGLYFPGKWSQDFTPVLSMNDPGESPKEGSLLIARYGEGYYVYTGLSFFREFPAGVPGAFRLFANLISLGRTVNN